MGLMMTVPVVKVLADLLAAPDDDHYGLALMQSTGLASGTLYPILNRLQVAGWVLAEWEQVDPAVVGRPARRYYRLTPDGLVQARTALAELHGRTAPTPSPVQPSTGQARAW
jgi:PadR family transcriptional regulator PadR